MSRDTWIVLLGVLKNTRNYCRWGFRCCGFRVISSLCGFRCCGFRVVLLLHLLVAHQWISSCPLPPQKRRAVLSIWIIPIFANEEPFDSELEAFLQINCSWSVVPEHRRFTSSSINLSSLTSKKEENYFGSLILETLDPLVLHEAKVNKTAWKTWLKKPARKSYQIFAEHQVHFSSWNCLTFLALY